jgi:hypothetical protein
MRRHALLLAALAAASACSVQTEGAPCSTSASCPQGQGCGADGRCSARALGCTLCTAGETRCGDAGLESCQVAGDGVCASFGGAVAPASHQACVGSAPGHAAIVCAATPCVRAGTACAGAAAVTTCAVDGATQCLFDVTAACPAGQVCRGDAAAPACGCPADSATGAAGQGCASETLNAAACDAASGNVVACQQVGACKLWVVSKDCASTGLACGLHTATAACECPANPGTDFYADPGGGSDGGAFPFPKGTANPAKCRFKKLGDALSAAIAVAPARAIATGFAGSQVVFGGESLPLGGANGIPAGVELTTSDPVLDPTHYVLQAVQPGSSNLIAVPLQPGATLSGFTIRNAATTTAYAAGVGVSCAGAQTPAVTMHAVSVSAAGTKPFTNAMSIGAGCTVTVSDSSFAGASGSAVLLTGDATTVATFHNGLFQGNGKSGLDVQGGAKVVVDGASAFTNNLEHGLALRSGEAVVNGTSAVPIHFAGNALDGILAGTDKSACRLTLSDAMVHENANGIEVVNNDPNNLGQPMLIQNSTFEDNSGLLATQGAGILVKKSAPDGTGAIPTSIVGCTFMEHPKHGIWISSGGGPTFVHVQANAVTTSGDWGVVVSTIASSKVELVGNTISNNGVNPLSTRAGGLLFTGVQPVLTFQSNVVKSNKGDQVGVQNAVTDWSLDSSSSGDSGCPATANTFACYDGAGTPSARFGLFVFGSGSPNVTAKGNAWANATPVVGADYAVQTGGNVADTSTTCPAVTTCP